MKEYITIGDERIDSEHQELFDLSNDIDDNIHEWTRYDLLEVAKKVMHHTLIHFNDEEAFMKMKKIDDDYFKRHLNEHQTYRQEVYSLIQNFESYSDEQIKRKIHVIILHVKSHILDFDVEMKNYL